MFSNDVDGDDIKYSIDWGDGSTSESDYMPAGPVFITSHNWSEPGEFKIVVEAYDGDASSIKEVTINIQEADGPIVPESNNFLLILLALLALMFLLLFYLLGKKSKEEEEEISKK